ncbi:glycosyltransferase involved in cell wall biosynthesis [Rhodobacter aestuarii]|uniref:Glycosyltransferase involved in cell wall bisynthesis n=1 Tax=Rhodobacter aestuarii TaxID=453582 RepID=A0A1N7MTJ1_9RHOB|nr:glycosyltransferase family 4 protein [Rhodobacter aestuarii]PTV96549.1 glycosyltransferase involved in cell wall biosynthesis [Rhodobacter aestuarii]SIS89328.1 Glycosyltransferase involved in cell wall bisynthesis [Rhodobacter aestuarii]
MLKSKLASFLSRSTSQSVQAMTEPDVLTLSRNQSQECQSDPLRRKPARPTEPRNEKSEIKREPVRATGRPKITCVVGLRGIPDVPGGIETHCEQLYPRLADLRPEQQFVVVGRRPTIGRAKRVCAQNLYVMPLAAAQNRYFETISNTFLGVLAARFRFGAGMIHLHGIGPGLFAPLARLIGLRVVLTHHGDDFLRAKWNRFAKFVLKSGERLGVSSSHAVIAVSASLAERLREDYPSKAEAINYIPNGADHILTTSNSATRTPEEWRAQFGLRGQDYILSVGRLVPEKGFADLIEAYGRTDLPAKLVIAGGNGGSDHDKELAALIAARGLQDRVVMTGSVPHEGVAALMKGARLFVLASHHEGLPIVALEASAIGTPVLLSDITANRDLGLEQDHYFPKGNISALAQVLRTRWNEMPHRDLLAAFNWGAIARDTHALYARLETA